MPATKRLRRFFGLSVVVFALVSLGSPAYAIPTELFFSEYIEGSSNNKALEIYNGTGAAIDFDSEGETYAIQIYFNGNTTANTTITLTGTVDDGDVYVLANLNADTTILAQADLTPGGVDFNGDDTIVLSKNSYIIDVFGQIGVDPGAEWGTSPYNTANNTLRRKSTIFAGDTNPADAFDPSAEWVGFGADNFEGLGTHTVVPIPPTLYLMGSGLLGLVGIKRRRGKK